MVYKLEVPRIGQGAALNHRISRPLLFEIYRNSVNSKGTVPISLPRYFSLSVDQDGRTICPLKASRSPTGGEETSTFKIPFVTECEAARASHPMHRCELGGKLQDTFTDVTETQFTPPFSVPASPRSLFRWEKDQPR